jgi:hypothetical protein
MCADSCSAAPSILAHAAGLHAAGRIVEVLSLTDPEHLAAMDFPVGPDETPSS